MILILLLILVITVAFWKLARHYSFWVDKAVKQRKQIYLLGDNAGMFFQRESIYDLIAKLYNAFPNERYMGMYQTLSPTLVLRDPDLIKQVTVKDFDHFLNHRTFTPDDVDLLWSKNLFALKECADGFMNYFLEEGGSHILEMKDIFTRYTNDVIASVAFGIQCDSLKERDNAFFTMGTRATKFDVAASLKLLFYTIAPKLSEVLGVNLFSKDVMNFFLNVVKETINVRESQGIVRHDMLNLLLEARKAQKVDEIETKGLADAEFTTVEETNINKGSKISTHCLTDMDIAAQALIFFFAGFEAVATSMSFTAYELTLHPDVQKKLQKEIDYTLEECKGKLTYEALLQMKYMDMVVSESLRKWPTAAASDRICTKNYTIKPARSHERPIDLKVGDMIWLPIYGLHYDPQYYPQPEKFDPERFNDENKVNIKPYTYLPFGVGPRNCIGSRFALMEIKTILFYILSKFNLQMCQKTEVPLKLKNVMQLKAKNGIWIELKPRVG